MDTKLNFSPSKHFGIAELPLIPAMMFRGFIENHVGLMVKIFDEKAQAIHDASTGQM